jgi:uncharacterized membrane protein YwzB
MGAPVLFWSAIASTQIVSAALILSGRATIVTVAAGHVAIHLIAIVVTFWSVLSSCQASYFFNGSTLLDWVIFHLASAAILTVLQVVQLMAARKLNSKELWLR